MSRSLKILVAFLFFVLTACSADGRADGSLTVQISGSPDEAESYRVLAGAFERASPGAKVNLVVVPNPGDHIAKLVTSFSAGSPPDLFLINYRRFGQFVDRQVLEPVGPMLAGSQRLQEEDFYPEALDSFRRTGVVQCMPTNISSQVVYYNKRLFARAGLATPRVGWRWSDLLASAKRLTVDTNGDGRTDVYGLGVEPTLVRVAPFVWQAGGEVVDDVVNPTKTTMLGPTELRALKFFIELRRVHRVVPSLAEFESEDLEARFAAGRLGMLIESRRVTPTLRGVPDLDWDVAPLPIDAEPATMLHSDALCMAKASKVKDLAFRFIEFATGPEGAPILARTGRTVPSHMAVSRSADFLAPGQPPAHAQIFLDQIPLIRRFPNIGTWNEIETKADPIVEEWFFGNERIEALGIEIDIATRELFAEARPAPSPS
ncbi:MAG: sugar ABC transporter substrate-binding protein [Actinomycetota bacterium]